MSFNPSHWRDKPEIRYELRLAGSRQVVEWTGKTGEDAARRYVDMHRDAEVIAWREKSAGCYVLGNAGQIIG